MKVLAAGLGVVITWASAFAAIRVAAPELGVIGLSVARLAIAAPALLAIAPFARVRRHALLLAAAALFGMTAYQLLVNAGELHVPAGTASIVVSASPLVSVALAAVTLGERLTLAKLVGSAIAGLAGVCDLDVTALPRAGRRDPDRVRAAGRGGPTRPRSWAASSSSPAS